MTNEDNKWKLPLDMEERELPKFPVNCLSNKLGKFVVGLAEEFQVSEDMVGSALLTIISLCNQGKYVVEGKQGWQETLNLFMLIIALPSEKKSPVCKRLSKPIYDYEKEKNKMLQPQIINNNDQKEILENKISKLKKELLKDETNEEEVMEKIKSLQKQLLEMGDIHKITLIADDVTPEALASIMLKNNEKMGVISAEGGIFSTIGGRYSNNITNCDIFLKSYSNETIKIDRKTREEEVLYSPLLTMLLFVQPIVLNELFGNPEFLGKGLCARFLYSYPKSKIGYRDVESRPVEIQLEEDYKKLIKNLLANEQKDKILKLSSGAYQHFINFCKWLEPQLIGELFDLTDWSGKLQGVVLRFAGNLHVIENYDSNNVIITEDTMIKAIQLGKYYLEHAKNVYCISGMNEGELQAKRIINILKRNQVKGEIKRHALFRMVRGAGINNVQDIDEPLEILIDKGYCKEKEYEKAESIVGRKRDRIIELNPYVFK